MVSSPTPPQTPMPATAMGTGMPQSPGATPPQTALPLGAVVAGSANNRRPTSGGGNTLAGGNLNPTNTGTKTLLGQ